MKYAAPMVIVAALFLMGTAFAAGPFDGEWEGATSKIKSKCEAENLKATIVDGKLTMTVTYPGGTAHVEGTVAADGTFKGGPRWEGKFTSVGAAGVNHNPNCGDLSFTLSKVK
jgi:hypothetical protein